jgi:hypothetical protein
MTVLTPSGRCCEVITKSHCSSWSLFSLGIRSVHRSDGSGFRQDRLFFSDPLVTIGGANSENAQGIICLTLAGRAHGGSFIDLPQAQSFGELQSV